MRGIAACLSLAIVGCGASGEAGVPCDRGELADAASLASPEDVQRLAGYTSISGTLTIDGGDLDLRPLACLEVAGDHVAIFGKDVLTSLEGLHNLVAVGNTLQVSKGLVSDMQGFRSLTHVGGSLAINRFSQLTSLAGLEQLETVSGDISIGGHPRLADLDSLRGLRRIEGGAVFTQNDVLEDVSGLANVTCMARSVSGLAPVGWGNLFIGHNPNLPTCAVDSLVSALAASGIEVNGLNCGNQPDACGGEPCADDQGELMRGPPDLTGNGCAEVAAGL